MDDRTGIVGDGFKDLPSRRMALSGCLDKTICIFGWLLLSAIWVPPSARAMTDVDCTNALTISAVWIIVVNRLNINS